MKEPSVLDYVKSRLMPWKYPKIEFPDPSSDADEPAVQPALAAQPEPEPIEALEVSPEPEPHREPLAVSGVPTPWRSLLALLFACAAQFSLRPGPERDWVPGVILLTIAMAFLIWSNLRGEWKAIPLPPSSEEVDPIKINNLFLMASAVFSLAAFASFGVLRFTFWNLALLALALAGMMAAFWVPLRSTPGWRIKLGQWLKQPSFSFSITPSLLLALFTIGIVVFFRFYRLGEVPPEMNSDHAEKILDIMRVLDGNTSIFFPNNGGREAFQMYGVAALNRFFGMPLDYLALKLITVLAGFLSLPFIYLLGKEFGGQRIAVLAFLMAGIAYWPNVVSRVGLRLPFYILFSASTLYFLLRGIRTSRRNQFIYAGISLGLGLYGYSADRILPLLVVVALGLYLIHPQSKDRRIFTLVATLAVVLVSFVIFLPLLRYILAEPDAFLFRTLTRMANLEQPLQAPAWMVFLDNTWRALLMFSWDAGEVWPISIPHSPALGIISGGLFYLGAALLIVRYLRQHHWLDLFLILSIPILMLPSIMALAFPAENPNLYRTGGVMIPVFLMVAIALDGLMKAIAAVFRQPWGQRLSWGFAVLLIAFSAMQNYDLVFRQYYEQYQRSSWNTSEMGAVGTTFAETIGTPETVYIMGFPHWVDTRLVPIIMGYPGKDFQLYPDQVVETTGEPRAKLFILNPQDTEAMDALKHHYPMGWFQEYVSQVETKDFLLFFAPPLEESDR
jgi:hypothetical protein